MEALDLTRPLMTRGGEVVSNIQLIEIKVFGASWPRIEGDLDGETYFWKLNGLFAFNTEPTSDDLVYAPAPASGTAEAVAAETC